LPFRVFASPARRPTFPPVGVLSWSWSPVQRAMPVAYRTHRFRDPASPLAFAPVLRFSAADIVGWCFRPPESSLSASLTLLQSFNRPTLASALPREAPLVSFCALQHTRVAESTTRGLYLPSGSAFRV